MLLKPLTYYFAGVATVAFAFSAASANPGRLGFGLGILVSVVGAAWALGSRNRVLAVAELLIRLAGPGKPKSLQPRDWRESQALPKRKRTEAAKNAWLDALEKRQPQSKPTPEISPDDPNFELFGGVQ